ncbi:MAG: helix-turn-helix domain-containing protein [Kiritimatiellae bacterium]|nr:helix-turn-helix domain-containing protein [Kiritimatiellia bacterium]
MNVDKTKSLIERLEIATRAVALATEDIGLHTQSIPSITSITFFAPVRIRELSFAPPPRRYTLRETVCDVFALLRSQANASLKRSYSLFMRTVIMFIAKKTDFARQHHSAMASCLTECVTRLKSTINVTAEVVQWALDEWDAVECADALATKQLNRHTTVPATTTSKESEVGGPSTKPSKQNDDGDMRLVGVSQAARLLLLSRTTIYSLIATGRLDTVDTNGCKRITMHSIKAFATGNRPATAKTAKVIAKSKARYAAKPT